MTSPSSDPSSRGATGEDGLKPCPFCGGEARFDRVRDQDSVTSEAEYIECRSCGACTDLCFGIKEDAKPKLSEKWNRRDLSSGVMAVRVGEGGDAEKLIAKARELAKSLREDADNIGHNDRKIYPVGPLLDAAKMLTRLTAEIETLKRERDQYKEAWDIYCTLRAVLKTQQTIKAVTELQSDRDALKERVRVLEGALTKIIGNKAWSGPTVDSEAASHYALLLDHVREIAQYALTAAEGEQTT